MAEQLILVSDESAVAHYASLSPDWTVLYANGKLPEGAAGFKDALAISPDAVWCAAMCGLLAESQRDRIRFACVDLTGCKDWDAMLPILKPALQTYTGSAPSVTSADSGASPSPAQPKVAEPAAKPAESTQAHDSGDWTTQVAPEGAETPVGPHKRRPRPRLAAIDGNLARAPDPDDIPLPAEYSEDQLAEHFVDTRGQQWRYVPEWSIWLEWKGDGWHRDTLHKVAHECKEITREALLWKLSAPLTADGKRKLSSKRMAWNVRDMAATHPKISILAEQLDADPWLLGVPGGVVDLKNGKLLDAEPEQYITRRCLVSPVDGPHPLFDRVLARACGEHQGMDSYLWRWFGYMLTGDVREEAFIFLYGPGGSGKSTLIKCLTDILGDYAVSIAMDALMEQKNPRHTQEIAKLAGMRLIYASETSEGRLWNEALVKDLTGRDTITARFMRGNDFNFKICGKLLLYGNAMPRLKSVGEEIRRRIHLVEYGASLAESDRDSSLKDRLVDEYPMILNSLIRGCIDWQDCHGLGKPESVTVSVDNYLEGEDSFALFIDECVQKDISAREPSGEVYRRYRSWASAAGEYTMSQKRFVQTLRLRGFETVRSTQGRMIAGLRLLAAPPHEPVRSYQDRD